MKFSRRSFMKVNVVAVVAAVVGFSVSGVVRVVVG